MPPRPHCYSGNSNEDVVVIKIYEEVCLEEVFNKEDGMRIFKRGCIIDSPNYIEILEGLIREEDLSGNEEKLILLQILHENAVIKIKEKLRKFRPEK